VDFIPTPSAKQTYGLHFRGVRQTLGNNMQKTFLIDGLPESAARYRVGCAVVAIDVIRATTMAITAAALGRVCYPVDSLDAAFRLARRLEGSLLAGEIDGDVPPGFDMNNSPAELSDRSDISRPLVLLSSSGTRLIVNARGCDVLYLACFRNISSTARHLVSENHSRIALLGAGSRGEFREEDQICCALIGAQLVQAGYVPENDATITVMNRWANAKASDCLHSRSVEYLKKTGQLADLRFILERIDDLAETFIVQNGEVSMVRPTPRVNREPSPMAAD
jgi:2-phosphosulfolactate phosphatase